MVLQLLKALAHESRLRLLGLLATREHSVQELAAGVALKEPTVSHHLAILREAGLVDMREEGKQTFYSLNQERVAVCCGQLMIKFAPETEAAESIKSLDA